MTRKRRAMSMAGLAALVVAGLTVAGGPVAAADDDITGVVTSASGPEAGVWVIAETSDFETAFRKIVVTDDAGRFLVPDLPEASYQVWVRGYGLVDSKKTGARPSEDLSLTGVVAPTPKEAAQIYPANYWYSLLEVPPASDFPGTGPRGNGIGTAMRTQADWIDRMKDGCQLCHQLGNQATREMPMLDLAEFDSTADAWESRIQAGGAGPAMAAEINRIGRPRALELYADWSDRIRSGELPPAPPAGHRAQRRVDHVGVGPPARHVPRQRLDRQARPHALPERADLRRGWGRARHHRSANSPFGPYGPADQSRAAAPR